MKIATWTRTSESAALPFTSLPAYAAFPLFPLLFYMRYSTLAIALTSVVALWYMNKKGYDLSWLVNRFKGKLCGNRVSARPIWWIRRHAHLHDVTR